MLLKYPFYSPKHVTILKMLFIYMLFIYFIMNLAILSGTCIACLQFTDLLLVKDWSLNPLCLENKYYKRTIEFSNSTIILD